MSNNFDKCIEYLQSRAEETGCLSFDDFDEALDNFGLSSTESDPLLELLQDKGIELYDTVPTLDAEDVSQSECHDFSRVNYDEIYEEIIEIDSDLIYLVNWVRALPPPQYNEVSNLVRQVANGDESARERLMYLHLRLVLKIALATTKRLHLVLSDAVGSGYEGLLTATEKFHPHAGAPFQTYASTWIYQRILRQCSSTYLICYYPAHCNIKINSILTNLYKFQGDEFDECLSESFIQEMFKETKMEYDDIIEYFNVLIDEFKGRIEFDRHVSWNQAFRLGFLHSFSALESLNCCLDGPEYIEHSDIYSYNGCDGNLIDFYADSSIDDPYFLIYRNDRKSAILNVLKKLSKRQCQVLVLRYGFFDGEMHTLEEVGTYLKVSRQAVQITETQGIKRLRKLGQIKLLRELYDALD